VKQQRPQQILCGFMVSLQPAYPYPPHKKGFEISMAQSATTNNFADRLERVARWKYIKYKKW